jgi:hypothetical protein
MFYAYELRDAGYYRNGKRRSIPCASDRRRNLFRMNLFILRTEHTFLQNIRSRKKFKLSSLEKKIIIMCFVYYSRFASNNMHTIDRCKIHLE